MKKNQIRELVNELRDIAIEYHGTQQLRERIARTVCAAWHHDVEKPNQPVSQTYNLPELIEDMEVSIDVSTCGADAGNRYFGTVTEVSELYTAKNGYILLVQDAEPNFDVNGSSPVQSPIDHGYRPECECSGCKATARICAELNNEEEEIFADGYNAAMLKVNKNASTELPNDANLSTSSQAEPDDSGLLPCPFCGSPAEHYPDGDMEGYIIMCGNKNGDCNLQTFGFTTPEEAEKAWNTRAAIPQTGNFRENPISSTNNFRKIADTSTNSPVTPDGYALVPVEPTDEMIAAAMNCEDVLFNSDESFCVQFGNIYEAMLAAAPQPEVK
ncbi:Lar family restriction alleviation protein [Salmonella enterica]|nr:Lar family restriction alleviation protein [Salmonella enterica]EKQ0932059.1 Lar family restriction alleviation protein [Salmonella enterica]EKQ0936649.1 Lar family restriction alleviation protein [Salmonella enterica]